MMRWLLVIGLTLISSFTRADVVVPKMTVRANTILTPEHISLKSGDIPGGFSSFDAVIGMESRVVLYAGRPIRPQDIAAPALVSRNELVALVFRQSGLSISTMGRALDRGAEGEVIRVMNLASKSTLFGKILANGSVAVSGF